MLFLDGDKHCQSLTNKRTGEFSAAKTLREKFGRLNAMKSVLSLDETPSVLKRSVKAGTKLRRELPTDIETESIPLMELSSLVEDIHVKKWEASQNTDLNMRESLGIDKVLQSIQGELLNNTSKSTEINKSIKRDTKKLEEVENDPTYSDEQRQLYKIQGWIRQLEYIKTGMVRNTITKSKRSLSRLQELNRPFKRFLIKIHLLQKEIVTYFVSRV